MSSALDMSLDDIIKTQKANRPARNNNPKSNNNTSNNSNNSRSRGSRSSGPARNTRNSRDKKPYSAGVQQYRSTPAAPLHTSVLRQNAPDGSKMQVSNLDHRVSADDLKLVFQSRVGPLKKCTLMYDQNGKSTGTALVHFQRVGDAALAYQKFNTVPLDGKPMRIEIVLAPTAAQAVLPGKAPRASNNSSNNSNNSNNNRPRREDRGNTRGRTRGGRGARTGGTRKETPKTTEQLDAEMNDYMQVDA
ncbi:hypothetical protein CPC16_007811 [Podila verticillata]|nr:hypothetical protein BGZ59_006037 [Podila verticillata]KAF9385821.1 hypothetical protein CPC16_007811 [Podila verticillata]KAI9239724.1 MAG: hypothetical protein BYD32DRAFT_410428 [Podila humilis]